MKSPEERFCCRKNAELLYNPAIMNLTEFSIKEITDKAKHDALLASMKRDRPKFVETQGRVWMASFKINGLQRVVAIRAGHDHDVDPSLLQLDLHLRVNEDEFDTDNFIPEAEAGSILALVSPEVEKQITT